MTRAPSAPASGGPLSVAALLVGALAASMASGASAQVVDTDRDGAGDEADAFPCDFRRASVSFAPAEGAFGTLLFEDNWPSNGDLDFNDAVVLYNFAVYRDASGGVSGLRMVVVPRAVGASIVNGLALRLPVPAASVRSIQRAIGEQPATNLSPVQPGGDLVVRVADALPDLFPGATGFINTQGSHAPIGDGQRIVLDVEFHPAVSLSVASDPFDLFFFRARDPRHEIHRPQFGGTDAMLTTLFGTADDGSSAGRHFVSRDGLPFVLSLPQQTIWPVEFEAIESIWPNIVDFAASGGASSPDFYARGVITTRAFPAQPDAAAPLTDHGACFDADEQACAVANGSGVSSGAYGTFGPCFVTSCDPGYRLVGGACARITYAWSAGDWGACSGGSATPSYGTWTACTGGSGAWSYGGWSACSSSAVCSGAGIQSRTASCELSSGSGSQTRDASCAWDAGSSTQSRQVLCLDNFGELADSTLCSASPPAPTQSCTRSDAPICASPVTTQSCTPTDTALCGAATTAQACVSPAGTRSCAVANGTGAQTCDAGGTTWNSCAVVSCNNGFRLQAGACVLDSGGHNFAVAQNGAGLITVNVTNGTTAAQVAVAGSVQASNAEVRVSPNGTRAVLVSRGNSTSAYGYVATFDMTTTPPTLLARLDRTTGSATANIIPGPVVVGDTYALVQNSNTALVYSVATGAQVAVITIAGNVQASNATLHMTPDGRRAALVSRGNSTSAYGHVATIDLTVSPPVLLNRVDRTTGSASANLILGNAALTNRYLLAQGGLGAFAVDLNTGLQAANLSISGNVMATTATMHVSPDGNRAALVARGNTTSSYGHVATIDLTGANPVLVARVDRTTGASSANLILGGAAISNTHLMAQGGLGAFIVSLTTGQQVANLSISGNVQSTTATMHVTPDGTRGVLVARGNSTSSYGHIATIDLTAASPVVVARVDRTTGSASANLIPGSVAVSNGFIVMQGGLGAVVLSTATGLQVANLSISGGVQSTTAEVMISPTGHRAVVVSRGNSTSAYGYLATIDLSVATPVLLGRVDRTPGSASANIIPGDSDL